MMIQYDIYSMVQYSILYCIYCTVVQHSTVVMIYAHLDCGIQQTCMIQ